MKTMMLEIRDEATRIAAMATRLVPDDENKDVEEINMTFLIFEGYPLDRPQVILTRLHDGEGSNDPYAWGGNTMAFAHQYILENWDTLIPGQVIDVRVIRGVATRPADPEIYKFRE